MSRLNNPAIFPEAHIPLLFAHRGYSSRAPENTLAAFRVARDAGIPGIELDIHRCASGELVVIHDHDLKRLTGSEGIVEELDWKQLQALEVGSSFGEQFRGERIPLLEELFAELGSSFYFDVEIKEQNKEVGALERDLVDLVRQYGLGDRVLVSSFNPYSIRMVKSIDAALPTAIIYSNDRGVPPLLRHGEGRYISKCDVLKPSKKKMKPWPLFINQMIMGYPTITWTVDSPELASRILKLNVTGIISNDPEPMLELEEFAYLR